MARTSRKQSDEKLAQKYSLTPIFVIARVLAAIGKPIYLFLFIIIRSLNKLAIPRPKNKKSKQRKVKAKQPKKKFVNLDKTLVTLKKAFDNLRNFFRFEGLRLALLELKFSRRIKKFFSLKISRFQKFKLKKKVVVLIIFAVTGSILFSFYFFIVRTLPSPEELTHKVPQVSTKIYDRNGEILYKIYKDENRTIIPLSQIPVHVRLATLAAEDAEFYDHPGFSLKGITRAILLDIEKGTLQGGSTITQQLVKNVLLTPEKTFIRKIKEIVLSVGVEATYTKDQILEMYLNQVSFGGTAYGIEEAAREFFGKDAQNLSLSEAAFLAGLPQSPTTYSPYGTNPDLGIARQHEVLHLMAVNKYITEDQEEAAKKEKLIFISNKNGLKAPHFVMYIRSLLVAKYGEEMVEKGGLEVTTSLDLQIQEFAESVVREEVGKLKALNVGNGAALVLNPKTGEILAMVGSADYFDASRDGQVNVPLRLRQPGSSIKVVNYAYALEAAGYTPATLINDSPITYVTPGSPPYSPANYDRTYKGNVTLRSALAQSRNIPAVKILVSYGVTKMIDMGRAMGITSWEDPSKFGLSLTLGGGAVTGLDLATVYSTIANSGKKPEILPILQVKDYKGKVLEKSTPKTTQVLSPEVAFLLTDILKDNAARAPEFGLNSYLVVKDHPEVAVKTGTSNDLRDNWTAGFNQDYLVVTWVGNNDNSPMSRIASGVTGASPIWNKIVSGIIADKTSFDWPVPQGVVKVQCPGGKSEWFRKDQVLPNFCSPSPSPSPAASNNQFDSILEGISAN